MQRPRTQVVSGALASQKCWLVLLNTGNLFEESWEMRLPFIQLLGERKLFYGRERWACDL